MSSNSQSRKMSIYRSARGLRGTVPRTVSQVLVEERQQFLPGIFVGSRLPFGRTASDVGTLRLRVDPHLANACRGRERPRHAVPGVLVRVMLDRMFELVRLQSV